MNRHKKNIEVLRKYLGRDTHGINLLDEISRSITDLRKQVVALTELEQSSQKIASYQKTEALNAQIELMQVKAELEIERRRKVSLQTLVEKHVIQIAKLEKELEPEDESPLEGVIANNIDAQKITTIFKEVRKRYRNPPDIVGKKLYLEDIAPNLTNDEFLGMGMFFAALALHNLPIPELCAQKTICDIKDWKEKNTAKFIYWCGKWIHCTPLEEEIYGPGRRSQKTIRTR